MKIAALGLALALFGCASQAQLDASHRLAEATLAATDPASPGGVSVTAEEKAEIDRIYRELKDAQGIDWQQLFATLVAALVAGIPALRYGLPFILPRIPNEKILGQAEALALERATVGPPKGA